MRRVFVDPASPQTDAIEEAISWILDGKIVALATDTLYGLAVDPFNRAAVARLFAVKGRGADRAVPLIAADVRQIGTQLGALPPVAARLAAHFWPGPLTLAIAAPAALPREVTGGRATIAVRIPAAPIARAICAGCGNPITSTSANLSGRDATPDPDEVERTLGDRVDFLLDTGRSPGGAPSTLVDVTTAPPSLVRAGAIPWEEIQAWLAI